MGGEYQEDTKFNKENKERTGVDGKSQEDNKEEEGVGRHSQEETWITKELKQRTVGKEDEEEPTKVGESEKRGEKEGLCLLKSGKNKDKEETKGGNGATAKKEQQEMYLSLIHI